MNTDTIRTMFSEAMSEMYRREVPLYGTLLDLVATINQASRETRSGGPDGGARRVERERHGAIRVGLPEELGLLRRLFAVLGMVAVGYYDLSQAGLPVHSTAFRPIQPESLRHSPFRIFASLLRLDLIQDAALREQAHRLLRRRRIVTPRCQALIERFEREGCLDEAPAHEFVAEALETFRWHAEATVDGATYERFRTEHPLLADIVCFKGPHINHLTPRVLDIDAAQQAMLARGIEAKAVIEGPPRRRCPILLRQTSFKALSEPVRFGDREGAHTARFGEIEQRGVALTPAGRKLYDRLLAEGGAGGFSAFPDDHESLRSRDLAYYHYTPVADLPLGAQTLAEAIRAGSVRADPIRYQDFLPVSAAGIFRSNLSATASGSHRAQAPSAGPEDAQGDLEDALGCAILDPFQLYESQSRASAEAIVL